MGSRENRQRTRYRLSAWERRKEIYYRNERREQRTEIEKDKDTDRTRGRESMGEREREEEGGRERKREIVR